MENIIDLKKSLEKLCNEYPELIQIMKELGFDAITDPIRLKTIGRFMTIPKGAVIKNISLEHIISTLKENEYKVINIDK